MLKNFILEISEAKMKNVKLIRFNKGDFGVIGHCEVDDREWCSIELPDKNNKADLSCIPTGEYICKWTNSPHLGRMTYEVIDVPGREGIRIHSGNWAGDTTKINPATDAPYKADLLGCIALGLDISELDSQEAIIESKTALAQFETYMNHEPFVLTINENYLA